MVESRIGESDPNQSLVINATKKTEGFDLGTINNGNVKSYVLRFSTDNLSDTKQGKTGIYDFIFDAIGL